LAGPCIIVHNTSLSLFIPIIMRYWSTTAAFIYNFKRVCHITNIPSRRQVKRRAFKLFLLRDLLCAFNSSNLQSDIFPHCSQVSPQNVIRVMGRLCRNAYNILVGKPEGKRPLGRPRRIWEDNIKIHLRVIGWEGVDWMHLDQHRDQWRAFVNTAMNLRVP